MNKNLVAKELLKLARELLSADKEWTHDEWAAYKKEHPGTKIKPKMKKETGKKKTFSENTDAWFDTAAEAKPKHEDSHMKEVKKIVNHGNSHASMDKLNKVHEHLKKSNHPAAKKMIEHIDAIKKGDFKGEFKNLAGGKRGDGQSSQVKEFFSMAHQGLNYNN